MTEANTGAMLKVHQKSRLNRPDRLAPLFCGNEDGMAERVPVRASLTLRKLYDLCEKRISEARQAVSDAHRIADEKNKIQIENRRLHDARDLHR